MLPRWMLLVALVGMPGCMPLNRAPQAARPRAMVPPPLGVARPVPVVAPNSAAPNSATESWVVDQGKRVAERYPKCNVRGVYPLLFKYSGRNPKISAQVESDGFLPIPVLTTEMPPGQAIALLPATFPPNLPYVELRLKTDAETKQQVLQLPPGSTTARYNDAELGMSATFGKGMLAAGRAFRLGSLSGSGANSIRINVWLPRPPRPGYRVHLERCRIISPFGELPLELRAAPRQKLSWDLTNPFAPYFRLIGIEGYAKEYEAESEILPVTLPAGARNATFTTVSGKRVVLSKTDGTKYRAKVVGAPGEFWIERLGRPAPDVNGELDLKDLPAATKSFRLTIFTMRLSRSFPWYLILPVEPASGGRQRGAVQ